MSDDGEKKRMIEAVGRPTARDALEYAVGFDHGHCTVVKKGRPRSGSIAFRCVCNVTYVIRANEFSEQALRNVPEDKKL